MFSALPHRRRMYGLVALVVWGFCASATAQPKRGGRKRPASAAEERAEEPQTDATEEGGQAEGEGEAESEGKGEAEGEQAEGEGEAREDSEGGSQLGTSATPELSARVDALMDRMVRARTRIAALGEALFKTRVELTLDNRVDDFRAVRVRLLLDGAPVHVSDGSDLTAGQRVRLYAGYAAPGIHELQIEAEMVSQEDDRYQYDVLHRFRFRAPKDKLTELRIRLDDDSDIAEDFEDDEDGEYDVQTQVRVLTRELEER